MPILFGLLVFCLYSKYRNINAFKYLDIMALVMPLCQAIGRFGNYFNQEAYGFPTNSFIKLYVSPINRNELYSNNEYFHPTFLYESILNLFLFVFLNLLFFKNKKLKQGSYLFLYLTGYSLIRIIVEFFRIDNILSINNIAIAHVISFIVLIVSVLMYFIINNKRSA